MESNSKRAPRHPFAPSWILLAVFACAPALPRSALAVERVIPHRDVIAAKLSSMHNDRALRDRLSRLPPEAQRVFLAATKKQTSTEVLHMTPKGLVVSTSGFTNHFTRPFNWLQLMFAPGAGLLDTRQDNFSRRQPVKERSIGAVANHFESLHIGALDRAVPDHMSFWRRSLAASAGAHQEGR
jgi:hypothetical protein